MLPDQRIGSWAHFKATFCVTILEVEKRESQYYDNQTGYKRAILGLYACLLLQILVWLEQAGVENYLRLGVLLVGDYYWGIILGSI